MNNNTETQSLINQTELPALYSQWEYTSSLNFLGERKRINVEKSQCNKDLIIIEKISQSVWQRLLSLFFRSQYTIENRMVYKKDDINQQNIQEIFQNTFPIYNSTTNKRLYLLSCPVYIS